MDDIQVHAMPGQCEHVTKMGRVKNQQEKVTVRPQFRQLPFLNQNSLSPISPTVTPEPIKEETLLKIVSPQQRPLQVNFIEAKLGRNMRATPKGSLTQNSSVSAMSQSYSQHDKVVHEPLLHTEPLPTNVVVDYFINTCTNQPHHVSGVSLSSCGASVPTIASPQHPSQDLIEMLNRNHQASQLIEKNHEDKYRTVPGIPWKLEGEQWPMNTEEKMHLEERTLQKQPELEEAV